MQQITGVPEGGGLEGSTAPPLNLRIILNVLAQKYCLSSAPVAIKS